MNQRGMFRKSVVTGLGASTSARELSNKDRARFDQASTILAVLTRRWFHGGLSNEANRIVPAMLLAAYAVDLLGTKISRRDVCTILGIDRNKTGARYVAELEKHGLLVVERKGARAHMDLLSLTLEAKRQIEKELEDIQSSEPGKEFHKVKLKSELETLTDKASAVLWDKAQASKGMFGRWFREQNIPRGLPFGEWPEYPVDKRSKNSGRKKPKG